MNTLRLILRELRHHRLNALLSLAGLTGAVALLVIIQMTTTAAARETRRVMRDLGFNLRIIPKATDMDHFWAHGFSDQTMPADTVTRLAAQQGIFVTFNHLTPALEGRLALGDREFLLTGVGDSVVGPGEAKQPMGFKIARGHVYLGSTVAQHLKAKRGSTLPLKTRDFNVERVLAESGTEEDVRIFTSLADAQELLGHPGRINEIKAIDCLCLTADKDPLAQLRAALEKALPEAKVLQLRTMADARARQRQMTERYARFAVPVVLIVAAVWLGLLAWLNVRDRQAEVGLWRALGHGSTRIAGLFLGKALLLGIAGALVGYAIGTTVALRYGAELFQVTAKSLAAEPSLLLWALVLAPGFSAVASLLPALQAVTQDPAESLRAD
ncbi:MAG: hypothetical protein JNK85_07645 [Verrucomicrobiales bacterium]|nr:hypothetical protein [Verrucomicrobiales bacterium]